MVMTQRTAYTNCRGQPGRGEAQALVQPIYGAIPGGRAKLSVAAVRGCENGRRGDCYDAAALRERRSPA